VVGDLIAGRYELEQLIASGGTASVFCAYDARLRRRVALKMLHERYAADPEYVLRFDREARAVAGLNHPGIVNVLDRGRVDGRQFIVFEYVEGENLKQLVERTGPLPIRRSLELTIQIGQALAFAHAHGVLHRDVKPQNVLLTDAQAKITDFGIARSAHLDELTLTGTILGTSEYMAPEQANGQQASERSDVYSLGILLFELLTGSVPFTGESYVTIALQHVTEPAPNLLELRPDMPPRLAGAVARALEKNPDSRFESMDDVLSELEACRDAIAPTDDDSTVALPPRAQAISARQRRNRRPSTPLVLLVAGLLLLAAAAAYYADNRSNSVTTPKHGPQAPPATVRLRAVTAYDPPPGDGIEDNQRLPLATDRNPATFWVSEWYTTPAFGGLKHGVGIVLDTGEPVRLTSLTVVSDTPGFTALVSAGSTETGPFQSVSGKQTFEKTTTILLHLTTRREYYLLWITTLSPATGPHYHTDINEVSTSE